VGVKFSNSNPAAPSGQTLVTFQKDASTGEVSAAVESGVTLTLVAGQNINAFQGVVIQSDGLAYKADVTNLGHAGKFIGVAETSVTTGNTLRIRQVGVINNLGFLFTPGNRIYVGGSPGDLIQTPPIGLYEQLVGLALSASDLQIDIGTVVVYA
jgi:hypothetical protein